MTYVRPVSRERLTDLIPMLRATLHRQRRFRLQQVSDLEAEIDRAAVPTTAADTARHEVTITLAAAARQALVDIDEALTLITTGRYGRCRRCHAEIPIHLLQTIPTSQWCLNCRQQHLPACDGSRPIHRQRQRPRTASRTPRREPAGRAGNSRAYR